jgi:hypothetical protein
MIPDRGEVLGTQQSIDMFCVPRYSYRIQNVCDTAYGTYRLAFIAIMMANEVTCTM